LEKKYYLFYPLKKTNRKKECGDFFYKIHFNLADQFRRTLTFAFFFIFWEGSMNLLNEDLVKTLHDDYTIEQHNLYKDSLEYYYYTDYYFDITSFY
jgi:hypothetical protein